MRGERERSNVHDAGIGHDTNSDERIGRQRDAELRIVATNGPAPQHVRARRTGRDIRAGQALQLTEATGMIVVHVGIEQQLDVFDEEPEVEPVRVVLAGRDGDEGRRVRIRFDPVERAVQFLDERRVERVEPVTEVEHPDAVDEPDPRRREVPLPESLRAVEAPRVADGMVQNREHERQRRGREQRREER